ncbi:MAG TPA: hypothetical protein DDZ80_10445 [Cyanobacteria bacterium UBA8803]|nr:hypothetical protein [Cyanobacteria bacterium UBA9273]HBL58910.1 hypothetical protein [Cyanobacteria bacterium UBA8803]
MMADGNWDVAVEVGKIFIIRLAASTSTISLLLWLAIPSRIVETNAGRTIIKTKINQGKVIINLFMSILQSECKREMQLESRKLSTEQCGNFQTLVLKIGRRQGWLFLLW